MFHRAAEVSLCIKAHTVSTCFLYPLSLEIKYFDKNLKNINYFNLVTYV